jgi:hypothetical protein
MLMLWPAPVWSFVTFQVTTVWSSCEQAVEPRMTAVCA